MARSATNNIKRRRTLEVLFGGSIPKKIPKEINLMAECIDNPADLYKHIEDIATSKNIEKYRFHLVRMQLESELRVRDDVDFHSKRLWVAQSIEKIVFGDLKVDGVKEGKDEE